MRHSITLIIIALLFSCQKESTQNAQRLCEGSNPRYVHLSGGDSAICALPNLFSPNGDSINDTYLVFGRNIQSASLSITDGSSVIFHTDSALTVQWEVASATLASEKVYGVQVNGIDAYGNNFSLSGSVGLLYYHADSFFVHSYTLNCDSCLTPAMWDGSNFNVFLPNSEFIPYSTGISCD